MIFFYDVLQGGVNLLKDVPIRTGGTTIPKGAALVKGITTGTDRGAAIVGGATALANVVGVLEQKILGSATDYDPLGTNVQKGRVSVNPMGVYLAEYSQATADTVAPTSDSSAATLNLTSIEDIGGGWIYAPVGGGKGQLQFIVGAGSGTLTMKATPTNVYDAATSKIVKIVPKFHELLLMNSTSDKIASAAAAGTAQVVVLENYIQSTNIPFQPLDPTKHSGLTGLDALNVKFFAEVMFRDHLLNKRL